MRSSFRWIAAAAALSGSMIISATTAQAEHERVVFDNHGGRPGGTGKRLIIPADDPRIQPPGKCRKPFLGGTAFGHPDPRLTDPKAVCGHGVVFVLLPPHEGRRPLLILPISTAPIEPETGAGSVASSLAFDPARLIRDHLPRLDTLSGDSIPVVVELRNAIRSRDVARAIKNSPKPVAPQRVD